MNHEYRQEDGKELEYKTSLKLQLSTLFHQLMLNLYENKSHLETIMSIVQKDHFNH